MRRFGLLALFALVLGCICCVPPALAPPKFSALDYEMSATVALLRRDDETGKIRAYCSGVWVSPSEILTAAHCTSEDLALRGDTFAYGVQDDLVDGSIAVEAPPIRAAVVLRRNEVLDLALLVTMGPVPPHNIAALGERVSQGERVDIIGHTMGLLYLWSPGFVTAVKVMEGPGPVQGEFYVVWSGASNGNSGGGMWKASGQLVGIASFRANTAPLCFFVAVGTVREFLLGP